MKRSEFLHSILLIGGAMGLSSFELQDYTRDQLIGKGNPDLVGNSYLTTMHKATAEALQKMKAAAAKEGISIEVVSAYRSFQRQKEIFEKKYRNYTGQGMAPLGAIKKIIEYSTIPGTSRHHWGTDLDLIDGNAPRPKNVLVAKHFHGEGPFCKMKEWMNENAASFGFYEVYTDSPNRKGFKYEPWHFSYAPVSIPMLQSYRKLDLREILKTENILGNEYFTTDFLSQYWKENIMDINPRLLPRG